VPSAQHNATVSLHQEVYLASKNLLQILLVSKAVVPC